MTSPLIILGWSTRNLPSAQVVDYAVHAIGAGLEPMSVEIPDPAGFDAALQCVVVGDVVVARGTGQSLRCIHARAEIARNSQRQYHIVLNRRSPWTLHHRGDVALRAEDAVVMDSAYGYDFTYPSFDNAHLQLSESWMRQWVRDPAMLAGRAILKDSPWGAALCSYLKGLTPEFMARAPLPASLLIDHLGALLALVAHDVGAGATALLRRDRVMHDRILETLRQRCTEPGTHRDRRRRGPRHLAAYPAPTSRFVSRDLWRRADRSTDCRRDTHARIAHFPPSDRRGNRATRRLRRRIAFHARSPRKD